MSEHKDFDRSTRFLTLFIALTLLLAGCSSPSATVAAPPVPISIIEVRTSSPEAPGTDLPAATAVPTSAAESGAYWPTEDWRTSSPEEQGMDSQKLGRDAGGDQTKAPEPAQPLIIRTAIGQRNIF
jgi:hypothetical protein